MSFVIPEFQAEVERFQIAAGLSRSMEVARGEEFWHVDRGDASWEKVDADGKLLRGDLLWLSAGASMRLMAGGDGFEARRLILDSDLHVSSDEGDGRMRICRRSPWANELDRVLRDCAFEKNTSMVGWRSYISARARLFHLAFLRDLASRGCRGSATGGISPPDSRRRVAAMVRQLEMVPRRWPQTMEQAAANLGLSVRRFSTLFRQVTGTTWLKFQHRQQLNRAKSLLRVKPDPLEIISLQSGFMDTKTFHRVFKNHLGITPAQWRNREQGLTRKAA